MSKEERKEILCQQFDDALAELLLGFEAEMCNIWETDNHCKNQKLRLIVDYEVKSEDNIEMATEIEVVLNNNPKTK